MSGIQASSSTRIVAFPFDPDLTVSTRLKNSSTQASAETVVQMHRANNRALDTRGRYGTGNFPCFQPFWAFLRSVKSEVCEEAPWFRRFSTRKKCAARR